MLLKLLLNGCSRVRLRQCLYERNYYYYEKGWMMDMQTRKSNVVIYYGLDLRWCYCASLAYLIRNSIQPCLMISSEQVFCWRKPSFPL
jgi:hypothetical protein